MNIRSVYRIIRFGLVNFWRNRWLSLAATLMMTITLLIISFFTILNLSLGTVSDSIKSRLDLEVFFFDDSIPQQKIFTLADDLKKQSDVGQVHFVSKDEAKANFQNYELDPTIISQITDDFNPLPRSLKIKVKDPEKIDTISTFIKQEKYSDIVCKEMKCMTSNSQSNKKTTQKLVSSTKFIKRAGWGVGALFVVVSVLIILNTVRLTIYTRKDEIEIMKLVGANNAFIQYPFVIESVLYAIFATFISMITMTMIFQFASPYMSKYLKVVNLDMMHFLRANIWQIIGLQLLVGLLISIFCSFISIRRHLRT